MSGENAYEEVYLLPIFFNVERKQTETGGETFILSFMLPGGKTVNIRMAKEDVKALRDKINKILKH
jgi:hypothetical protein